MADSESIRKSDVEKVRTALFFCGYRNPDLSRMMGAMMTKQAPQAPQQPARQPAAPPADGKKQTR